MSITHISYNFFFYYCMVLLVTLWNCGVVAITREGKLFHFVLRFFERKKPVRTAFGLPACLVYDTEIMVQMKLPHDPNQPHQELIQIVSNYMALHNIFSDRTYEQIVTTLLTRWVSERNEKSTYGKTPEGYTPVPNEYYFHKATPVFPDWVKDPVVVCVTCMASFHSIIIYTIVAIYKDFYWNPLEWVAVAIPCAFTGELLWSLKKKIQLNLK